MFGQYGIHLEKDRLNRMQGKNRNRVSYDVTQMTLTVTEKNYRGN